MNRRFNLDGLFHGSDDLTMSPWVRARKTECITEVEPSPIPTTDQRHRLAAAALISDNAS